MRIAVLTTESRPHGFLVGEIATRFDLQTVLLEGSVRPARWRLLARDSRRHGPIYAADKALFTLYRWLVLKPRRERIEKKQYPRSDFGVPEERIHRVSSINSPEAHARLTSGHPDVLVVAGTSILKPRTIGLAPVALNIHTGILPFYRGIDTVAAALRRGDQDRVGVTVHSIAPRVDSGDVHAQSLVFVEPGDRLETLETRVFRRGIELMLDTLTSYRERGALEVLRPAETPTPETLFFGRTLRQHAQAAIRVRLAASGAGRSS